MTRKTEPPPAGADPAAREDELRKRIERLEERLANSILGEDGLEELDKGIDKSPSGDPAAQGRAPLCRQARRPQGLIRPAGRRAPAGAAQASPARRK